MFVTFCDLSAAKHIISRQRVNDGFRQADCSTKNFPTKNIQGRDSFLVPPHFWRFHPVDVTLPGFGPQQNDSVLQTCRACPLAVGGRLSQQVAAGPARRADRAGCPRRGRDGDLEGGVLPPRGDPKEGGIRRAASGRGAEEASAEEYELPCTSRAARRIGRLRRRRRLRRGRQGRSPGGRRPPRRGWPGHSKPGLQRKDLEIRGFDPGRFFAREVPEFLDPGL